MSTIGHLWKNEYFQTVIMIVFIVAVVLGFFYGSRLVLNNQYPMLAVASGSMCTLPGPNCDGWSHPFEWTLHVGDLIVVQGVNASDIYVAPFNESGRSGDIIVFHHLYSDELIVHRAIDKKVEDGEIFFVTKGDGNSGPDQPIPADHVIGKVVLRIPWIGHLALFMRNSSGIYLIIALIAILVIIELVLPVFKEKKPEGEKERSKQQFSGTSKTAEDPSA